MEKTKKYDIRVSQHESLWTAEIIRRASSKKTVVSKNQGGFSTELEAKEWGQNELINFSKKHNEKNKRHAKLRE